MAGTNLQTLISRFPGLELSITRLYRDDPEFRSICEEIEMADTARARWQDMPDRADEYQRIFDRLQDEFLDHLSRKTRVAFVQSIKQGISDDGGNPVSGGRFRTKDGRYVIIMEINPNNIGNLRDAFGADHLKGDERFATPQARLQNAKARCLKRCRASSGLMTSLTSRSACRNSGEFQRCANDRGKHPGRAHDRKRLLPGG
ncbi:CoA transferase [Tropicimonas sp. IMCC6043]|uniref:CoA transferase n=1 Tax=Tropicimonas sp. IMCC6043 TaxID=2510645 RepID=UPI00101D2D4E|nr:CoA transferase [Tropicimonas sp. IMCC6043]RYH06633.1 hypothetical protein EU800_23145 [Tropicimonas sp. IMCC6043]